MIGGLCEEYNNCERRGVLVWVEPWCVEGWEVSEGFARKWGRLLRGRGRWLWRFEKGLRSRCDVCGEDERRGGG